MRKVALYNCLILLAYFSFACSGSPLRPGPDRLVVGLEGNPNNLDPRFATDAYSTRIVDLIYSSLIKLDEKADFRGDIASSWEQPSPTRYIFHLRRNILFHNGKPLTAEDVRHTFRLILAEDSKSPYKGDLEAIESIECPDEHTVVFALKAPDAPFMTALKIGIVPRDAPPQFLADHPVGSGPYRFVRAEAGNYIVLERFDKYFNGLPPSRPGGGHRPREAVFRVIPNGVTRALELERGGVDLLQNSIPPEALGRLEASPHINIERKPGINYNYIGFNLEDPILKERRVRAAIAHAIDRNAIIEYLWKGAAAPATGLLSPRNWAYNGKVETYDYNPAKAKKLLDEAGYADPDGDGPAPRFRLNFKTSTDRLRRRIAEVIRAQLAEVGVEVEVRSYEFGTFYRDVKSGNFQLYTLAWVGVTEPDIYRYIFHSKNVPPRGANRNRYSNPEIDRLTELGKGETDREKRRAIYAQVQEILAHDLPYISLYYTDDVAAFRTRVRGFRIRPGGDFISISDVFFNWSSLRNGL